MVKTGYMLDQPKPSDAVKRFIDQRLFPALIDAAAGVEGVLESVRSRVRKKPMPPLAAALVCGALASSIRSRRGL